PPWFAGLCWPHERLSLPPAGSRASLRPAVCSPGWSASPVSPCLPPPHGMRSGEAADVRLHFAGTSARLAASERAYGPLREAKHGDLCWGNRSPRHDQWRVSKGELHRYGDLHWRADHHVHDPLVRLLQKTEEPA